APNTKAGRHHCDLSVHCVFSSQHESSRLKVTLHMPEGKFRPRLASIINVFRILVERFELLLGILEQQAHDPTALRVRGALTKMFALLAYSRLGDPVVFPPSLTIGKLVRKHLLFRTNVTVPLPVVAEMTLIKRRILLVV